MIRRLKLGTKLVAVFLGAGLIPMLATGLYNYLQTQGAFKERILNENGLYVEQKARLLQDWGSQRVSELKSMLTIPALYDSVYAMSILQQDMGDAVFAMKYMNLERLLSGFLKEKGYGNAAVAKIDGTVIYDSNKGERSGEGKSIADRAYFKEAVQGKLALSHIFHSPILNEPVMVIAGPVRRQGDQGEVVGVFLVTIPAKPISEVILQGVERLGESGDTYLVDERGVLTTSSRRFGASDVLKLQLDTPAVKALIEQGIAPRKAEFYGNIIATDKQGRGMLTSCAVVRIGENLYGLVAEQEESQALGQLLKMRNVSLLSVAIAALFVGLCGFWVARSIAGPLRKVAGGLTEAASQSASASGQVASSSQSLAEGASQQAASLEETSSSLEEMASMTRQNADNARQANSLMQDTAKVVMEAREAMDGLTRAMGEISRASDQTARIIKTIDEIAFQTNLLALNAAVEAARAGEAGAGFAVVADEVRNLAQRAAQAARNTADLIEETVNKIKDGSFMVSKTNDAFQRVAHGTGKVEELLGEISAASQEQAQGIEQLNQAVAQMDKVVQATAANAEESASAAQQLQAQAQVLEAAVRELVGLVEGRRQQAMSDTQSDERNGQWATDNRKSAQARQLPKPSRQKVDSEGNGGDRPRKRAKDVIPMDEEEVNFKEF
jgi:methyl-accepting chemotaxis protein